MEMEDRRGREEAIRLMKKKRREGALEVPENDLGLRYDKENCGSGVEGVRTVN